VVPSTIVVVVERVPVGEVDTAAVALSGLHDTGTLSLTGAGRVTVGWPVALLHSRTSPSFEASKPDPVTVTESPPVRVPAGETERVAAAEAGLEKARTPTIPETSSAAAANARRVSLPNRLMIPPGFPRPLSE
jgi:hypothetical protein